MLRFLVQESSRAKKWTIFSLRSPHAVENGPEIAPGVLTRSKMLQKSLEESSGVRKRSVFSSVRPPGPKNEPFLGPLGQIPRLNRLKHSQLRGFQKPSPEIARVRFTTALRPIAGTGANSNTVQLHDTNADLPTAMAKPNGLISALRW